jgi:hypothetical protein
VDDGLSPTQQREQREGSNSHENEIGMRLLPPVTVRYRRLADLPAAVQREDSAEDAASGHHRPITTSWSSGASAKPKALAMPAAALTKAPIVTRERYQGS